MSKIYENENQMVIRFPQDVAKKLREAFQQNKDMPLTIEPKLGNIFEFDVHIPSIDYHDKGVLVDLPTITESYKTRDYINLFKSNDINQMIWVGKNTSNVRQVESQDGIKTYVCDSGLTPPTYDISKDFHRKQPNISLEEIQRVEKELDIIQKEFTNNDDDSDNSQGKKSKKYNKF